MKLPGIPKTPALPAVLDFDRLRREGISYIEALGSTLWTDYNTHDPGITLLEALCFAINDLGYRCSFPMKDLLEPSSGPRPPAGEGPLFSARSILSCQPVTTNDYRKLLMDVEGVRNAWLQPSSAPCLPFYPDRKQSKLGFEPSELEPNTAAVLPRGVSSVQLELDDDPLFGSINDTTWPWSPKPPSQSSPLPLEIVLPPWDAWRDAELIQQPVLEWEDPWLGEGEISSLKASRVLILDDQTLEARVKVEVTVEGGAPVSRVVPLRVLLRSSERGKMEAWQDFVVAELERLGQDTPLRAYRERLRRAFSIASDVMRTLQQHRGLCEDFEEPRAVQFEEISLCADVEVTPDADLEAVLAKILLVTSRLLAPPVRFHTLSELLAQGMPMEGIFEGPALQHGFLLDEDLEASEPPKEVRASDLLSEIMEVEGVVAVRSFAMAAYAPNGLEVASSQPWKIELLDKHLPRLSPDRCKFVFYKRGIPFRANPEETGHKLAFLADKEGMLQLSHPKGLQLDLEPPRGTFQALNDYRTVQHDLPRVYGIGPEGLPESADPKRKAQARQLKAYLLFFDQLLSNYLAQLSHLRELFSLDPSQRQTLFSEPLFQRAEFQELFREGFLAKAPQEVLSSFHTLAEDTEAYEERRNRLLDHLLARFNERFADYAAIMATMDRGKPRDGRLVEDKIAFLKDYPRVSSERGKGFDAGDAVNLWATDNVSGLERRLCGLLGIRHCERRNLAHRFEVYLERDEDGIDEYRFRLRDAQGKIVLSSSTHYLTLAAAMAEMIAVDTHASRQELYRIKQDAGGEYYFNLEDPSGEVIARRIERFDTAEEAAAAITHILVTLDDLREREGMHLVEHLLLRPMSRQYTLLGVTLEPDCEPCVEDVDPYTFRATLVLPAWVERFTRPSFRAFVEQTARQEAPAHVFLKICWVDMLQMSRFEAAYLPWLLERAKPRPDPVALAKCQGELVTALESLRSVYPTATLHDCQEDLVENPVLLGRTQLGTLPIETEEE